MTLPSISTDQVAAFVELSRQGTLRGAAGVLHITEQGLRSRLLSLEKLGCQRMSPGMPVYEIRKVWTVNLRAGFQCCRRYFSHVLACIYLLF